ncbi:unnamed protein product [Sphagnum jensenii]|uniref:Uncharacterized protein n=1 Tax=Sphagnum jensenii TaxID=128206 RepID=A0ABP1AM49_9BRYO
MGNAARYVGLCGDDQTLCHGDDNWIHTYSDWSDAQMSSYNGGPSGGDETLPYDELWCSQSRHGQCGGGGGSIQLAIVVDSKMCSTVSCTPVLSM